MTAWQGRQPPLAAARTPLCTASCSLQRWQPGPCCSVTAPDARATAAEGWAVLLLAVSDPWQHACISCATQAKASAGKAPPALSASWIQHVAAGASVGPQPPGCRRLRRLWLVLQHATPARTSEGGPLPCLQLGKRSPGACRRSTPTRWSCPASGGTAATTPPPWSWWVPRLMHHRSAMPPRKGRAGQQQPPPLPYLDARTWAHAGLQVGERELISKLPVAVDWFIQQQNACLEVYKTQVHRCA